MQFDKEDSAALLIADIIGDGTEADEDAETEQVRLQRIREGEARRKRPWHTGDSTPQCTDEVCAFDLGSHGEVRYRAQPWPPHAGEIVATGGIVWDSAQVLSKYLETLADRKALSSFSCAVELGAGLAVPSLCASRLGIPLVVATDVPARLPGIDRNIALNTPPRGAVLESRALDWGDNGGATFLQAVRAAHEEMPEGGVPLIICADVLFVDEAIPPLVAVIVALSAPGTVVLSCCEHRWDGAVAFYKQLQDAGFTVREVPATEQHALYHHQDIHLYQSVRR
eukprot:Hpha_TRINITY_DN9757_c0_g1::TRINITY_DN9757_c0_g1_i1::g.10305::m.10305